MMTENGFVIYVQWFDFSFGEEECMRVRGLEIFVYRVKIGGLSTNIAKLDGRV